MRNFLSKCWGKRRELGFVSLPLFFLALVFLDYAIRLVYRFLGVTRLLSWKPMVFTLCWALLLTALVSLLPKLGRRIAMGALGLLFALLAVAHGVMYNVFGHFFSFSDMNFAGDGAEFFDWAYLRLPKKYYFLIAVFLGLVALAICLCQRPRPWSRPWLRPVLSAGLAVLAAVPIGAVSAYLTPEPIKLTWVTPYQASNEKEVYRIFTDANSSLKLTGLYQYTARNLAISLGLGTDRRSVKELDQFYEARAQEISGSNDRTGALKDKNLIMVMLESIDTWMITPEYMPNLYRLQQNSLELTRFYTPLFLPAATFNTEMITQTGAIPPASGVTNGIYATNQYPLSLAHLFTQRGYSADSFHAWPPKIYNRGNVHLNLGFSHFYHADDLGITDFMQDSQLMKGYELFAPQQSQPFFSFLITYSGHGGYDEGAMDRAAGDHLEEGIALARKAGIQDTPENMGEYERLVAHILETDQFIGEMMDRLESDGMLEDTVLLFYADHYSKYVTDKEFLARLKGLDSSQSVDLYRTPCFFYGGGLEAGQVDKVCSSIDLVPTLVNLFDLDADRRYYIGDDIFGGKGGAVMFPNNGWYDGETYYDGQGGDPDPDRTAALSRRVTASMDTMRTDYFKHWEKAKK